MSAEADVVAVIESYVEGAAKADPDAVKAVCHESAFFRGFIGDQFTITTPAEYADTVVATAPAPGDDYKHQIHSVAVTGDIASATLDEQGYLGFNFRDNFGLMKIDGTWKIMSKVFTTV
ncbi:nuclear transport factor 2 family protein [Amycolatopsis sp. TRM77291]